MRRATQPGNPQLKSGAANLSWVFKLLILLRKIPEMDFFERQEGMFFWCSERELGGRRVALVS